MRGFYVATVLLCVSILTGCKKGADTVSKEASSNFENVIVFEEPLDTQIDDELSTDEIMSLIVEHYTSEYSPKGVYVIFDEENVETDSTISFILRYQPSDEEEEEMIKNGSGPLTNIYVLTVDYNKSTKELTDEAGNTFSIAS